MAKKNSMLSEMANSQKVFHHEKLVTIVSSPAFFLTLIKPSDSFMSNSRADFTACRVVALKSETPDRLQPVCKPVDDYETSIYES